MSNNEEHTLIFISHRHDDKALADVFNRHLQLWGIPSKQIFQSSDGRQGIVIGEKINESLRDSLSQAHLVILIYTTAEKDWSYCMWECGVATDPTDATPLTRIAVCRAGKDVPPVFEDSVLFSIDEAGILSFTGQFHREEDFFIKGKAFQKNVTDEIIQSKGNALLKDLRRVLPPLEKREERYRWDFFTLKINPENIIQIKNENNFDKKIEFIKSESEVERDFGQALKHFNFDPNTSGLKLANIINRWLRSITKIEENTPKEWINDLCGEMLRAIDAEPSKPTWQLMRSMLFHDWWFYPIVNHVRVEPNGTMEFDIYMYRLPGSLPEKA